MSEKWCVKEVVCLEVVCPRNSVSAKWCVREMVRLRSGVSEKWCVI